MWLEFAKDAVAEIARIAWLANERMENIGARRLHTVMATLIEDLLFDLPDGKTKELKSMPPRCASGSPGSCRTMICGGISCSRNYS